MQSFSSHLTDDTGVMYFCFTLHMAWGFVFFFGYVLLGMSDYSQDICRYYSSILGNIPSPPMSTWQEVSPFVEGT